MAYSDNPLTLQRMLPQLRPLVEGAREVTWRTDPGRARWFAYRIREALRLARAQRDAPEGLKRKLVVKVLSSSYVRVRDKEAEPEIDWTFNVEDHSDIEEVETHRLRAASTRVDVDSRPVSVDGWLAEIQEQWLRALDDGSGKLYLPKAWPTDSQMFELWSWTQQEGILIFEDEGAITLMLRLGNENAAAYSWEPSDE